MVELPRGWTTEEPNQKSVYLPEGWSLNAPPEPPARPPQSELQPPKEWQKTRVPIAGKMNVEAKDIPGAPALFAATNLGGSEEDLPALQKHLSGIAEQEKNVPETEYSKSRKEGKGFIESASKDIPGFLTEMKEGAKRSIIPMTGAAASSLVPVPGAAVTGGGLSFAANAYANALINETRKYGGKLDDAKQFNETYLKNKQAIDEAATKEAAISGAEGAVFGMIPGGGGLKGMLGRLGVAYPSVGITGEGARRMANEQPPQTPEEMLQTGVESAIMGAPFEVAGLGRGRPAEGAPRPSGAPPEAAAPQAPQLPSPAGPAPVEPRGLPAPQIQEAPAVVSPTPSGPVEARGPVTPPVPAAPSEVAAQKVQEGARPLEAIKEVGESAPVAAPPEPVAEKPSLQDQVNIIIGKEVSDRTNQLVEAGMPQQQAVAQAGNEVAQKYSDPQALAQLASILEKPAAPNIEPAPFNAPAAKPQPQPKAAEPEKPKQAGEVKFAEPEAAPKLDKVEGNKYISMPASRFADAITNAPNFLQSNQQDDPDRIPESAPIQVRLDPSKLQNVGERSDAIASAKDAIQQVIVGPNAFLPETGPKDKKAKAVERNKRLQTALDDLAQNHGVSITYVGQKQITPKKRATGFDSLVGLARAMGGVKDDGGELRAMDLNRIPGIVNNKSKTSIEDFVRTAIMDTDWYPEFKAQIAASDNAQPTPEMIQRVKDDFGARRSFKEPALRPQDAAEEEAYRQNVMPAHEAENQILNAFGRDAVLLDPDVLANAVNLVQNKNYQPIEAYEQALLQKDRSLGLLTPEEADEWIKHLIVEERPNEARPQPAQATRPASGAPRVEREKPAAPKAAEAVSERPQAPVKAEPEKVKAPEEAGAEGKPQLVIPGAEKISQGEHAQRLAEKPMQAKVAQKEPEGLFGEDRNQIDLLSMPEAPKPIVKMEEPKPAKDFGPFKAGQKFSASKNVNSGYAGVTEEWAKMLGIDTPIYLTTFNDAKNSNFGAEWQHLVKAGKGKGAYGSTYSIYTSVAKDRFAAHVILLQDTGNREKDLETIAHELGHILQAEAYDNAPKDTKKKVNDAYKKWKDKAMDMTVLGLIESKKAKATIERWREAIKSPNLLVKNSSRKKYYTSFDEYFADQVARWAMTSDKPLSVVEKFFKGIGSDLRKLYHGAKKEGALPNETFKEFIENVTTNTSILRPEHEFYTEPKYEKEVFNPEDEVKIPEPRVEIHRDGVLAQGLVDKFSDLYKVEKAYEKLRGAPLPDNMSGYLAQELFNNRVIARQDAVWKDEVKPLLDEMKRLGITTEDFGAFLYARHAEERNDVMRSRDPKRFSGDGGSGMTNQTARDILKKFREPVVVNVNGVRTNLPSQYDLMDRLDRDFVRPIIRKDLNQRLQFGTLNQQQYDQYMRPKSEGGYNHYVPLRGSAEAEVEADENIVRSSRKFGVSGKDFQVAFGRASEAFNPLFNLIQQRMEGIVRQEKNKVDNALAKFVKAHPDNKMAQVITSENAPIIKYLAADGTVRERAAFTPQALKTILPYKEHGEQKYLQFDKDNPAMVRLVEALNGMPANAVNPVMNAVFQFSRLFSRLNTSLVPDFFLTNFPRDVQDALVSMYVTKEGLASRFLQDIGDSAKIIFQMETGRSVTEADRALYQEWIDTGGKQNYGGFRDIATTQKDIEKDMRSAFGSEAGVKENAMRIAEKSFDTTIDAISKVNDVFEDTVRFAVYRAARQNGYSKERAASLSLNSTVNFQTKGAWMPVLNSLKPFLSASVGSLRAMYRLAKNNPKRFGQFLGAILFASIANSLLGVWMSDKDEVDPNKSKYFTGVRDYERQKNFIIPYQFEDGHFAKLPFGFYYSPITVMGDNIAGILTGNITPEQAAVNTALSVYDYANPLGSGTWGSQLLFTPFSPFVQHAFNKDWLGRPIRPEETKSNKGIPASEQYSKNTPDWALATSKFLNSATWGDQYKKGWIDVYPDVLNHYYKFFTEGLGQFVGRGYNATKNYFENTPTPVEDIPYLRRLMTNTKGLEESKYYDVKSKVTEKENLFKSAMEQYKNTQNPEAYSKITESAQELNIRKGTAGKPDMSKSLPTIFRRADDVNDTLKEAIEITRADKSLSPIEKQSRVADYEKQIKENMLRLRKFMYEREPSTPSPLMKMMGR